MTTMRVMFHALVVLVAATALLALLVRLVESRLAFFPERSEPVTPASIGISYEPLALRTSDGETLRAWWMPRDDAVATVFYLHGNGGNLSLWLPALERVWRRGHAVFAIDYRGYGVSTGSPSEAGLYRDLDASLEALASLYAPRPVVYWGRSLGSVMAAYAATRRAPDGLILEAGFPDARAARITSLTSSSRRCSSASGSLRRSDVGSRTSSRMHDARTPTAMGASGVYAPGSRSCRFLELITYESGLSSQYCRQWYSISWSIRSWLYRDLQRQWWSLWVWAHRHLLWFSLPLGVLAIGLLAKTELHTAVPEVP